MAGDSEASGSACQSDEKRALLETLKENPLAITRACKELKTDPEVLLEAARQVCRGAKDPTHKEHQLLAAAECDAYPFGFAGPELRADKAFMLEALRVNPASWQKVDTKLLSDREFVLEAVKLNGEVLRVASEELQGDKEVVMEAVRQQADAISFAARALCGDKDVMLAAVQLTGHALHRASKELRADRDVVLAAIKEEGSSLIYALGDVADDEDILVLASRNVRKLEPSMFPYMGFHKQAAAFAREDVKQAAASAIAVPGEDAPIVSVKLTYSSEPQASAEGEGESAPAILAEALLMSGTSLACGLPDCLSKDSFGTERPHPTINDLAQKLVARWPADTEAPTLGRIFVNFVLNDDGDAVPATVWDWSRPLTDFIPSAYKGQV
eukprot:CAMPEP_0206632402 /NCGR_PEP_ID=MMETSP0325_2-20121206/68874_1 /ASSEMBLY_ACC=CAM_ASM_000347 /TAXON_ID=2866 /ORGANISM="Crypthecodinium cohnii, Strain Seligo" /LENGTH=383 /DNA_ID=CAMNT_0054157899 /DNA_START=40 /DNA_END=1191 /DNA_ORIENTATION=-